MRRGVIGEQQQQQMGCMTTFLHIFHRRHHFLTGKRLPPTHNYIITSPPTTPGSEKQRPSISVVARLMGLDEPTSGSETDPSSEVNRYHHSLPLPHDHYRFFDTNNNLRLKIKANNASDSKYRGKNKSGCFYDSGDYFPEKTKKKIERRLKRRGIDDEAYKDDVKQILEALQLKGLLHSNNYKSNKIKPIRAPLQDNGRDLRQRRSPNRMSNVPEEDQSSTLSHSSLTTIISERYKMEEYRNVLERCDKLLNSIAEMTATTTELQQPSPVSVFDSSFYKDDSPSPLIKRCIHYKEVRRDSEEDKMWSADLCENGRKCENSDDFMYVSEIVRACNYFPHDTNVFMLLEKQQFLKGNDTSKTSMLRRRLIFDIVQEILNKNKRLPPWKAVNSVNIWLEFKRMREREEEKCSEGLVDVTCSILRKDMAQEMMNECCVEMGDVVLDLERLLFKDLVGQIIRDLASFKIPLSMFPRKFM
ncbi:hypothetical protein Lal_00032844 [Lupinus albus]|uniref:DUF4378 domain-containing protein n=1 Tax=Lupinus albus TaxID=3870 RepID=A0A6A5PNC9_LUPAL|nr:putative protein LONGIFOLIA 1/2 [Lupinus albus]KAF1898080.1 hypothetical protein Lal_00032844 [Lupinus albus]